MQQCNGQRGRVWQRGPLRVVLFSGFIQVRLRRLVVLSYFTVAGSSELWLGVPGWTGRLWPPRRREAGGGRRENGNDEQGEGA